MHTLQHTSARRDRYLTVIFKTLNVGLLISAAGRRSAAVSSIMLSRLTRQQFHIYQSMTPTYPPVPQPGGECSQARLGYVLSGCVWLFLLLTRSRSGSRSGSGLGRSGSVCLDLARSGSGVAGSGSYRTRSGSVWHGLVLVWLGLGLVWRGLGLVWLDWVGLP